MLMGKQLTQSLMFEAVFRITTWSSRPRAGLYRVLIQSATSFQDHISRQVSQQDMS